MLQVEPWMLQVAVAAWPVAAPLFLQVQAYCRLLQEYGILYGTTPSGKPRTLFRYPRVCGKKIQGPARTKSNDLTKDGCRSI